MQKAVKLEKDGQIIRYFKTPRSVKPHLHRQFKIQKMYPFNLKNIFKLASIQTHICHFTIELNPQIQCIHKLTPENHPVQCLLVQRNSLSDVDKNLKACRSQEKLSYVIIYPLDSSIHNSFRRRSKHPIPKGII